MNKLMVKVFIVLAVVYIIVCLILYFFQEQLIFFPEKLHKSYQFSFSQRFEEMNIQTNDGKLLHGVLFKTDSSKGLIFYLHGNAGSIRSWGEVAALYTDLGYDLFMLDYRGYGKSEGSVSSERQLFTDMQTVYDQLKTVVDENKIIIMGYSIGTGPASQLASTNNPRLLILQAPYYSLVDIMKHTYPVIPTFILKYRFETNKYLKNCKMPVVIFHGNLDEVINYQFALKLKRQLKENDRFITLEAQGHNGFSENEQYIREIQKVLVPGK